MEKLRKIKKPALICSWGRSAECFFCKQVGYAGEKRVMFCTLEYEIVKIEK